MNTDRHLKNELSELAAERNARKIKELREGSTEKPIDWRQARIQAAIAAMQALRSNTGYNQCTPVEIAKFSVTYADALVKENERRITMTYKDKLKEMTDDELDKELQKVIDSRAQGYQMLGCRDFMIEASIKLHDEAIAAIKTEKSNRGI